MTLPFPTFPLALGMPGPFELILLMGLGLLFFGKRLPEVGRSIGQTVVQFKKGLNEMENDIRNVNPTPSSTTPQIETHSTLDPSQFKFDPHTGKPIERPTSVS